MEINKIYNMDCSVGLKEIEKESINLIFSSPPYNIGKEYETKTSKQAYIKWQSELITEYYRVLKTNGCVVYQVGNYVEHGAVYPIDCLLFNEFILNGFIPRNRIIWTFEHGLHCTKRLSGRHETALWFTKSNDYTFNLNEIRVPQKYPNKKYYKGDKKGQLSCNPLGKNPSDVWSITNVKNNHPEKTEHPCQYPLELANRVIKAFSNENEIILDPFIGSGTTAVAAIKLNRSYLGFEKEELYIDICNNRINNVVNK